MSGLDPAAALAGRVAEAARVVRGTAGPALRLRMAKVVSHDANALMTVLIDGVEPAVSGVRRVGGAWLPAIGGGVWLAGVRPDLWAVCSTDADVGFSSRFDRTTNQSINTAADTAVSFDVADPTPDLFGAWAIGDPTNVYAPASGRYKIDAYLAFASNATGSRSAFVETSGTVRARAQTPAVSGAATHLTLTVPARRITVGVAIQLKVRHDASIAINLTAAHLSVVYLGP